MHQEVTLNQLLKLFYETIDTTLKYKNDEENQMFVEKIFKSILTIFNQQSLFDQGMKLIKKANCLNTIADANMLNLEDILSIDEKMVMELKSELLFSSNISYTKTFNQVEVMELIYEKALSGYQNSCMLLAILNWFGINVTKRPEVAQKIWKMLAYNGNVYAIECLIYSYKTTKDLEAEKKWITIKEIYSKTKDYFMTVIDNDIKENYSKDCILEVEKILCVINRNRHEDSNKKKLNLSLLYYVSNSKQSHQEIINNICNYECDGYIASLRENYFKNKQYTF